MRVPHLAMRWKCLPFGAASASTIPKSQRSLNCTPVKSTSFRSQGFGCVFPARSIFTTPSLNSTRIAEEALLNTLPVSNSIHVNAVEYMESIQHTGKAAVLFSDSYPVLCTVDLLYVMKDLPGLTWITTIISGTVLIRMLVGLPVSVIQQKATGRLESLKPEIMNLTAELRRETALAIKKFNWDEKTARRQYTKSFKKHWKRMMEEHNCHPMRTLALAITQLPFWICFSSALRNVVYAVPLPRTSEKIDRWIQIHNESTPWVDSLVLPDPVVLPVIFLVSNLLNIEFSRRQRLQNVPESKLQKIFPWVLRGGIVVIACLATTVPSAVSMYWATSSTIAFAQNIFLTTPTAKRLFKTHRPQSNLKESVT